VTLLLVAGSTAGLVAGCGSAESLSERAVGAAVKAKTGQDVNIDVGDGAVDVSGSDGAVSRSANKVPQGFPDTVPLPAGVVTAGQRVTTPEGVSWSVAIETDSALDATVEEVRAGLAAAGFTVGEDTGTFAGGGLVSAQRESLSVEAVLTSRPTASDGTPAGSTVQLIVLDAAR
jgi:hypothetical protein